MDREKDKRGSDGNSQVQKIPSKSHQSKTDEIFGHIIN